MSSGGSEAGSLTAQGRRAATPKSDVEIHLKHHYKTKTYTSGSPLDGEVTITTTRDIRFDSVEIALLGASRTRTEGYSTPHESTHTFLKLTMPIPDSRYPVPRVLESGRTLTIPFNFVLPSFLTLSACHHKIDSDKVRDYHLCLPPSMGSWARGNWEKDDLAPHMAEVEYTIKARVWREPEPQGRQTKIMEAVKSIQVLPAFPEEAPLNVTKNDGLYRTSRSKMLRRNLLSSKLGQLTASGVQPRAIMLHPDGRVSTGATAQVDLTFEPVAGDVRPPRIAGVSAKIVAHTYYSASAVSGLPNTGDWMRAGLAERRGVYSATVALHAALPTHVGEWRAQRVRRDSGYGSEETTTGRQQCSTTSSSDECDDASPQPQEERSRRRRRSSALASLMSPQRPASAAAAAPALQYKATLLLPVDLPTAKRTFVPSFHSCIVSRVYTLHVTVRVECGGASTLSLDLPVQVGVEGGAAPAPALERLGAAAAEDEEEALPSWEDALEDAAVDEFLRPRVVGVPVAAFREVMHVGELPGYGRI